MDWVFQPYTIDNLQKQNNIWYNHRKSSKLDTGKIKSCIQYNQMGRLSFANHKKSSTCGYKKTSKVTDSMSKWTDWDLQHLIQVPTDWKKNNVQCNHRKSSKCGHRRNSRAACAKTKWTDWVLQHLIQEPTDRNKIYLLSLQSNLVNAELQMTVGWLYDNSGIFLIPYLF